MTIRQSPRIAAALVVRDALDILPFVVRHHLRHGVDRFYVLDNGSVDGTRELLARLARHFPLVWRTDDGEFDVRLAHSLYAEAADDGVDWIVPVDADEFWDVPGGLKHFLAARTTTGGVSLDVVNFVQWRHAPGSLAGLPTMVVRPAAPVRKGLYERLQAAGAAPPWIARLFGRKIIARAGVLLTQGYHKPLDPETPIEYSDAGTCLHAPIRSLASMRGKPRYEIVQDDGLSPIWAENTWVVPNRVGSGARTAQLTFDPRLAKIAFRYAREARRDLAWLSGGGSSSATTTSALAAGRPSRSTSSR